MYDLNLAYNTNGDGSPGNSTNSSKLRFDPAKIRNSEDETIIASLESSHRMLISSRARIVDSARNRELTDKEKGWIVELNQQEQSLINQARAANLLLEAS